MIESIAGKMAFSIKQANPDKTSSVEVMKFSLMIILNTVAIVVFSLIIGGITGRLWATAVTLFSFALLKQASGGRHLKSSEYCVLWSTVAMSLLPHIPIYESWVIWMTATSCILVLLFAPANMNKQARITEKFYPLLKMISLLIVASNFIFDSDTLAKVFILQATMLIPFKRGVKK